MQLLERESAVAALEEALAEADGGSGRVVLVAGEAGIGKTALVTHLAHEQQARRFLWGVCDPLLTPRALGPIHDIAREVGGPLADRDSTREEVFAALLDELASRRTVMVVEDLHWADEASLDAIAVVGRRIGRTTGTLVLTYRSDEIELRPEVGSVLGSLPADVVRRVDLAPLSPSAVEQLAWEAGRSPLKLHATTGGNPFLVREVLASMQPGVPASVRALVALRLSRLSGPARDVVELVSVVPTRTELWLLGDAAGALDECVAAGLLQLVDDAVAFRHELARAAVAESLGDPRRRELEQRVLDVLEAREDVDAARLSHHARGARLPDAILRHAGAAARTAVAAGAHRQALDHGEAALAAATQLGEDRAALLELVSEQAYLCGHLDRALAARRDALALHEAAGRQAEAGDNLRCLSQLEWWNGNGDAAFTAGRRAIEVLEPLGRTSRLGMAYSSLSQLYMTNYRTADAIELGTHAIALATEVGDDEILSHALTNVGSARLLADDREGAEPLLERAIAIGSGSGFHEHAARALTNLSCAGLEPGDPDDDDLVERALRYAREHEIGVYETYLVGLRARCRFHQGDWVGAESDARRALAVIAEPGISPCPALIALGQIQARHGDAEAGVTLAEAWRRAQAAGELQRLAPTMVGRLEYMWLGGDAVPFDEAREVYALALDRGSPWLAGRIALWLWRLDAPVEPDGAIAEPFRLAIAGNWRDAAAYWAQRGRPYDAAEALTLGDDAAQLEALATFDRLGATATAARVRRSLRERGVRVPHGPRAATRELPHGLTPRQHEVLALIATGATNAEIASQLVVSTKTVDHHVSAVLAKLGVASRKEAAEAARAIP
jgi:DNA-binding CsgD family transcriptional regulator/tetratricopeptide (TPR) repeat protein